MDGRHIPWRAIGAVLLAAAGCRHNNKYPDNMLPQGGQPAELSGAAGAKSPNVFMPKPVEFVEHKKGPLSPEFEVSMAEVKLQRAFDEQLPVANRDQLLDSVRAHYDRALKLKPKSKEILMSMGRMYVKIGDKERAADAYAKCVKHHPKEADVHHEVALMHAKWQDWNAAIASCNTAVNLDPANRIYRKTQGFCLARAGRWDEGFAALCQVMPEAQARHNMAGLLDQMGQTEACRQQLMLALQADPNYGRSREFLMELNGQANPVQQAGYNEQQ